MAEHEVDLDSWPRTEQFRWFKGFARPHYAVTVRLDATRLMTERKPKGTSVFRACLHAIGHGLHAVPELNMRFRGDVVVRHDRVLLSSPVPRPEGGFNFSYVPFHENFAQFDTGAVAAIAEARQRTTLEANTGRGDAVAYMSCLPWMDFTSLDNAMPHADDCIPRVAWGKIVPEGACWRMAMSLQVHHALVDGEHLGAYFAAAQEALDGD
ncbi:chloramphenicol acetyltransferase [Antarctobacter heliothermus]|uniref:Chloramphenicol O-acetyltransferase type A n=1 Tax=Antarctobacter heliothermus TaxID=74033 RepID=A0A239H6R2_9RHOB|nr:chloramphenicol acetyltransferase [Antarctobacter heliothermus]SNS76718.1 chloramphenicol O-acetyltransferase type A [Antarctobacter heliothermus]